MHKFTRLKKRIKKNEGFRNKLYFDQVGRLTVGYGHLIKNSENFSTKKKYSKKYLNYVFENDFKKAIAEYKKHYKKLRLSNSSREVLIEMIFQLGIKKVNKFKRFNKFLKQKLLYLAALEMINSLWYIQTPKRVDGLIKVLLSLENDKYR